MANTQLYNLNFHSKWGLRMTCTKFEGVSRHKHLPMCTYELLAGAYLQIRIKWSQSSCTVVFFIQSSGLHHARAWLCSGLHHGEISMAHILAHILKTTQWHGLGREPLVPYTICVQIMVNEINQHNPNNLLIKFRAFRRTPHRMKTIAVVFVSLPGVKFCISMIGFIQTASFNKQMSSNCEQYWLSAVKISIEWVSQSSLAKIQHISIQHQALIDIAWPVDHWWRIYASANSAIIVSGVYMMSQNNPVYTGYAIC